MSNFKTHRSNDEDLTSPSSDEKMDTGSESFRSQGTPNSVLSSDFEGDQAEPVLRLQNPEIFRLAHAEDLNDSLNKKMSTLTLDSPQHLNNFQPQKDNNIKDNINIKDTNIKDINTKINLTVECIRPKNLGVSPPKLSSTLTLTTSHPLMSPDENYPDLIPKKLQKLDEDKDLSLSSIEDERPVENNGFYSPQRNTSKNNLYFSEAFATAEGSELDLSTPPDVARIDKLERRKLAPKLRDVTPLKIEGTLKFIDENKAFQSTPKTLPVDINVSEEFHSVAEWCESPSHLRTMPNFELPIEMSSSIGLHNDIESPDVLSASSTEERSAYCALLDPRSGRAALTHTPRAAHAHAHAAHTRRRRKIQVPPEDDRSSLDSVSACSMESDEEVPQVKDLPEDKAPPTQRLQERAQSDDEDTNLTSKSTNTQSECSEPIPEYSAAEELSNERAWVTVPRAGGHATADMKVIEPYKRVVSHGGYDLAGAALIVFSACHLPDCARADYTYVMDNLFLYVIWTLERLVTDEYVVVYLHGSAARGRLPTFHWLHQCYKLLDRRLRKSLKHLYLVHPTFWLKSFVMITKPFVSSKFHRKLSYIRNLTELTQKVPVDSNAIPELVKRYDATRR